MSRQPSPRERLDLACGRLLDLVPPRAPAVAAVWRAGRALDPTDPRLEALAVRVESILRRYETGRG